MLNSYSGKEYTEIKVYPSAGTNIEFIGIRNPHSVEKEA